MRTVVACCHGYVSCFHGYVSCFHGDVSCCHGDVSSCDICYTVRDVLWCLLFFNSDKQLEKVVHVLFRQFNLLPRGIHYVELVALISYVLGITRN